MTFLSPVFQWQKSTWPPSHCKTSHLQCQQTSTSCYDHHWPSYVGKHFAQSVKNLLKALFRLAGTATRRSSSSIRLGSSHCISRRHSPGRSPTSEVGLTSWVRKSVWDGWRRVGIATDCPHHVHLSWISGSVWWLLHSVTHHHWLWLLLHMCSLTHHTSFSRITNQ